MVSAVNYSSWCQIKMATRAIKSKHNTSLPLNNLKYYVHTARKEETNIDASMFVQKLAR